MEALNLQNDVREKQFLKPQFTIRKESYYIKQGETERFEVTDTAGKICFRHSSWKTCQQWIDCYGLKIKRNGDSITIRFDEGKAEIHIVDTIYYKPKHLPETERPLIFWLEAHLIIRDQHRIFKTRIGDDIEKSFTKIVRKIRKFRRELQP